MTRTARGFTLLEILVVLVITGLLSVIVMQALSYVFRLETHFGAERFQAEQGRMYGDWFRRSVAALVPDHPDGKHIFRGEERELRGLTLAPLDTADDALEPFVWRLQFDSRSGETQLRYGDDDRATVVLAWRGTARFVYLDDDDQRHDAWPPPLGKWPQLPRAIAIELRGEDGAEMIVASPRGPPTPTPRLRDLS